MKKTLQRFITALLAIAMCMSFSSAALIAEDGERHGAIAEATETATTARATQTYYIGGDKTYPFIQIFSYSNPGYRGPITVHVIDFNTSDYLCDIMVYGKDGLLSSKDDWLGNTNLGIVNPDGAWAVKSVVFRIRPRPRLLFEAKPKDFRVEVTY